MELQKRIINTIMWAVVLLALSVCAVFLPTSSGALFWLLIVAVGIACTGFAEALRWLTKGTVE